MGQQHDLPHDPKVIGAGADFVVVNLALIAERSGVSAQPAAQAAGSSSQLGV